MNILSILKELISIKSITKDKTKCNDALMHVSTIIPSSRLHKESNMLIWGHTDLSTTKWLINTHIDVVPGNKKQFTLTVQGDRVSGRGTADTKGSVAVIVNKAHDWLSIAQEKGITFMLVSDEEVGGETTKNILNIMNNLKGSIFLEPTNLHVVTEAKGMMQLKITSAGIPSHGSRPWEGDNAIEKLVRGIVQFRLAHPSPTSETRNTTYNFSQINGGKAINQVPNHAELWCDIRFNPTLAPEEIFGLIKDTFKSCKVTVIKNESPIHCDQKSLLFQSISKSLKANSVNPIKKFDHGTSDARHATALGIPTLVIGPKGNGLHADNEWVSLKSLEQLSCILDHWIKNI